MTAKMTDNEILDKCYPQVKQGMRGYLIPEVMNSTLHTWKESENHFLPQIQQLQEKLSFMTADMVKRELELQRLTAKHERLAKISEDILNAMVKDDVDDMFEAEKELRKLLTESEDGK